MGIVENKWCILLTWPRFIISRKINQAKTHWKMAVHTDQRRLHGKEIPESGHGGECAKGSETSE
jgi:hypothetical protein